MTMMTRMTRMPKMPRIPRKKMMTAAMRLSSQILLRRRSPRENEKPSRRTKRDEPGEDEGEGGGDDRDERKKKRKPNTCTGKSEVNRRSLYQRKEDQETLPQALESELTFKLTCRRYAVSISEHLRAKQSQ